MVLSVIWLFTVIILVCKVTFSHCLSRSVLEEDEVYSVARLLGDLVAYRASGTGHLELLIGPFSSYRAMFQHLIS